MRTKSKINCFENLSKKLKTMKLNYLTFCLVVLIGFSSCSKDDDTPSAGVPVATEATDITNSSFLANWNSSENATEYELQVATEVSFDNVTTKSNLGGPTVVEDLDGNTEYFYRVRATNLNENPSAFSNVISVITLPDAPVALAGSDITQNSFQANWDAVAGVTDYLLYVSKDNFTSNPPVYVNGYEGKNVTGTSHQVTGLDGLSFYYYRLESKVENRISAPSNSQMVQTQ